MNRQYGALSGVAIVLIVLNHIITAGDTFSPVEGWAQYVLSILQALGAFAVPTFLFISGAFVAYAARGKSALSLKFIWGSVKHILWPYLIWSAVFYLTILVTRNQSQSPAGYIKSLLVGFPYHFVPLLLFYYIISPLLVMVGKRFGWLLLLGIALYQLFLLYAVKSVEAFGVSNPPGWTWYLTPPVLRTTMADWAIYFPMGLVFSMHNSALKPHLQRWKWVSLTAVILLFLLGLLNVFGVVAAPWARFVAPVPLMFLLPIINRHSIPAVSRFEQVGRRSYGVYLIHFILLDWVLYFINMLLPGLFDYPIFVYPMLFVVALFVPLLIMEAVAKRPSTRKVYRYVFG